MFEDSGKGAPPILLIQESREGLASLRSRIKYFKVQHRVLAVSLWEQYQIDSLSEVNESSPIVEVIAQLCSDLGIYRPVAVGQGIGGVIAFKVGLQYPDLLAGVVGLDTPVSSKAPKLRQKLHAAQQFAALRLTTGNSEGSMELASNPVTICKLPSLIIQTKKFGPDPERIHELNPHVKIEILPQGLHSSSGLTKLTNDMIETFLHAHINL